jgi:hypothetical protein
MHVLNRSVQEPLYSLPFDSLCPGSEALDKLLDRYR